MTSLCQGCFSLNHQRKVSARVPRILFNTFNSEILPIPCSWSHVLALLYLVVHLQKKKKAMYSKLLFRISCLNHHSDV